MANGVIGHPRTQHGDFCGSKAPPIIQGQKTVREKVTQTVNEMCFCFFAAKNLNFKPKTSKTQSLKTHP